MNDFSFLKDFAVVMMAAGTAALVCHWLKQPKVLGFIFAGLLIGPHIPGAGIISNEESIMTLADMGVVFLMFSLGMDFNLRKLASLGSTPVVTAGIDVLFTFWLGFMLGHLLGWNMIESLFLGAIICDSSTTIVTRTLTELGHVKERYASIIIGATIFEDLIAIVLIALLTGIAMTGAVQPEDLFMRIAELVSFLVAVILAGFFLVRRFINYVARFNNDELLMVTVIGVCFTVSLLAARMQFSLALGAFIIGAVMAETNVSERIARLTQPVRDVLAPIFFVAMGMLIDPHMVVKYAGPILLITAVVIVGKISGSALGAFASGTDRVTSFRVGCGMAQICEFAIIFAALGNALHATRSFVYSVAVTVSVATTAINPHITRHADSIEEFIDKIIPKALSSGLVTYTRWIRALLRFSANDAIRKVIRRSMMTISVNLAIITTIFITVTLLAKMNLRLPVMIPDRLGGEHTLLWFCGALASIPLYVATVRKLNALSMLAAEMSFPLDSPNPRAGVARTIAEKAFLLLGIAGLSFFTFMLSSALLPPFPVLLVLLAVVVAVTIVLWRFQIRLYSKAQNLIRHTFSAAAAGDVPKASHVAASQLKGRHILPVEIPATSAVVNRKVGEIDIHRRTGATISARKRTGKRTVDPEPNEIILEGDILVIVGSQAQLEAARRFLTDPPQ